jgi:hypothetical protein
MPIAGPGSYPPAMALFAMHWLEVNTDLGAVTRSQGAR